MLIPHLISDELVKNFFTNGSQNENRNVTCELINSGDETALSIAKNLEYRSNYNDDYLLNLTSNNCAELRKHFYFPTEALTDEELNFPLGFALIVYGNAEQVIRMLSSIYWPQNLYCLTYDAKSSNIFKQIMRNLNFCFPNIISPANIVNIEPCKFSVLQAAMDCLEILTKHRNHNWRYDL